MRKRQLLVGAMLLFLGAIPLLNSLSNGLRAIDCVRLIGSGACFGVAIVAILGRLRLGNE